MKFCLNIAACLLSIVSLCAQPNLLPNPDGYPADTILIMLREDTSTNEFKVWVINRTDSVLMLDDLYRVARNWLEVKDDQGKWQVYKSYIGGWYCGTGSKNPLSLRKNSFKKFSSPRTPGTFQTSARARFALDSVDHYSSEIDVSIDTTDFLYPDLRLMAQKLRRIHKDSNRLQSMLQYYRGTLFVKKGLYEKARKSYAQALALNSTNYRAIIAQGDLKMRLLAKSNPDEDRISEVLQDLFASYKRIPTTETEIQASIKKRREVYAQWLRGE